MDPGNLQAWLDARRHENGLSSADLQPWHVVITYDQFDEDGDNVHSGVVEEFWGDPQRARINFKSDELAQTDFTTERGLYRAGDQRWQKRNESEVRLAVIDPFANAAILQGLHFARIERTFGDHMLGCDVMVFCDDRSATNEVIELVNRIPGLRGVDVGGLGSALAVEALTAALVEVNRRYKAHVSLRVTGIE